MSAPLVFLDTETDGVHPGRKVWEVAMIRRDDAGEHTTEFFVDIDLETSDPFGLKVGRFYERHPYGRYLAGTIPDPVFGVKDEGAFLRPRDAAHEVARFTHGAHIVGAVPNFDAEVLAELLRSEHLASAWHYHLIDVEALAVGFLHGRTEPHVAGIPLPWRSDDLSRAVGVEPPSEEERHTAMGDARWAMRLYDRIVGGAA
ncbi:hypothetical protein GV791_14715 [Nocardia cyriacigeorgica]|uniref:Exonuclease domain-containing protein n=1 Tax=Nocardia cyriacigeorgica TaxID=135487 RepID=A0A6P1CMW3_9NOCA|nr:hypothetical protein [Nocardia cyriacigeorgica]NEW33808.1 hypothetical protein [Nocardia cyriacigeorgica]